MQRQLASGQVTVPLQFLEPKLADPATAPPPPPPRPAPSTPGRSEFPAYSPGRAAEFVPVGAA